MFPIRRFAATEFAIAALVGALLVSATPAALLAQAPAAPLFADAAFTADRAADPTVVRSREVSVSFAQLGADAARGAPTALLLNLFPDATYTAVLDRIDRTARGFVWVGHIPDVELSTVTLATENSVLYGSILMPAGTYLVRPSPGGTHTIAQIDPSKFPPEANPIKVVPPPGTALDAPADPGPAGNDDGSFIDVMMLYTPAAAAAAGGASAMSALVNNSISTTNTTYANSGIAQRLRLVYSAQVAYAETGGSTGIQTDLNNITAGAGALSGVAGLRNTYRADLVTLLTNTAGSAYCGIAWMMTNVSPSFAPYGYNVVEQSCAVGNLSFPHELGHNMGAGHDWYVDNGVMPYTYSHGFVNAVARWRTVMAYNNLCANQGFNCSRIAYWSNPGVTYGGAPMGVAGGTNSSSGCYANLSNPACDADDHRSLNNTALTVANFQQGALTVTSLTANRAFPVEAGTPVTWTAAASGGVGPYSYRFFVYDGSAWSVGQEWSSSNTFVWTPTSAGSYSFQVWVRNAGSGSVYDAWLSAGPVSVSVPAVITIVSITSSASSVNAGSPLTWTAKALGGSAPYTYKFFVFDGATWSVGQEWSASATWAWTPPRAGTYSFQVWARNAGSGATWDTYRSFGPFSARVPSALAVTEITPSMPSAPAGTPVTWTATAAGGSGPYTYKFWVYNGSSWSVGQDWNASRTWTWIPPGAGSYSFQVWARNAGSGATYDAWRGTAPYSVTAAVPLAVTSLSADRTGTIPAGTPTRWTAKASGGTGPYTFKFYLYNGSTWTVGQDWSASSTWDWVPLASGTYYVQVWVRNAGSAAAYDAWAGSTAASIGSPAPLTVASFKMAPMSPLFAGASATLTGAGSGGVGPYTYKFYVYNGSTWTIAQDWSASPTLNWTPPTTGTYQFQVWLRNAGSSASWNAWAELGPVTVSP